MEHLSFFGLGQTDACPTDNTVFCGGNVLSVGLILFLLSHIPPALGIPIIQHGTFGSLL
jgi:hypothetical protein